LNIILNSLIKLRKQKLNISIFGICIILSMILPLNLLLLNTKLLAQGDKPGIDALPQEWIEGKASEVV
jgi:hypothetical protein